MRNGVGTQSDFPRKAEDDLHLPDASPDRAGSPRELPDLRDDAGTEEFFAGGEEENPELRDMTRRLWIGAALSLPVFILAMWHLFPSSPGWVQGDLSRWVQFILSTPVVLWAGWPFFKRGWQSIRNRSASICLR